MAEVKNAESLAKDFAKLNDHWSDQVKLEQWGVGEDTDDHKQRVLEQKQFADVMLAWLKRYLSCL